MIVNIYDASVVCVTETWFTECMGNDSVALHGFCLERKDRRCRQGGGVACYVNNDVIYKKRRIRSRTVKCLMDKDNARDYLENVLVY